MTGVTEQTSGRVYLPANQQAPYLQLIPPEEDETARDDLDASNNSNRSSSLQEADAAAGLPAIRKRLSSSHRLGSQDTTSPRRRPEPARRRPAAPTTAPIEITPDWRLRERMKTVGVGLVLALNVGTDPPDIVSTYHSVSLWKRGMPFCVYPCCCRTFNCNLRFRLLL